MKQTTETNKERREHFLIIHTYPLTHTHTHTFTNKPMKTIFDRRGRATRLSGNSQARAKSLLCTLKRNNPQTPTHSTH